MNCAPDRALPGSEKFQMENQLRAPPGRTICPAEAVPGTLISYYLAPHSEAVLEKEKRIIRWGRKGLRIFAMTLLAEKRIFGSFPFHVFRLSF